jgi:energy-coupling factor transporter ATP-binding protein EcfA2
MVDPRILVLDDALSAVDTYTEEEILTRLRGVMRERTSIIVSHRISTVRDADQIFVLKDGPRRRARHARPARRPRRALRCNVQEATAGRGAAGQLSTVSERNGASRMRRASGASLSEPAERSRRQATGERQ